MILDCDGFTLAAFFLQMKCQEDLSTIWLSLGYCLEFSTNFVC